MKKIAVSVTACICALLFSACAGVSCMENHSYAMDTFLDQKVYGENAQALIDRNCEDVLEAENILSSSLPSADVYKLNETGKGTLSELLSDVLEVSEYYRLFTNGAFDERLGELTELWDIGGENERVPDTTETDAVLSRLEKAEIITDGDSIEIKNMKFNFGAVVKGYMLDVFAVNAAENGTESALFDFGGSIAAIGLNSDGEPWTVGVNNPVSDNIAVKLKLTDAFVSTSGSYQRFFLTGEKKYHHIFDPSTGFPADNGLVSVSVVSESGIETDALSTALFVMGPEEGFEFAEKNGIAAVFITEDGSVEMTSGMAEYDAEKQ